MVPGNREIGIILVLVDYKPKTLTATKNCSWKYAYSQSYFTLSPNPLQQLAVGNTSNGRYNNREIGISNKSK